MATTRVSGLTGHSVIVVLDVALCSYRKRFDWSSNMFHYTLHRILVWPLWDSNEDNMYTCRAKYKSINRNWSWSKARKQGFSFVPIPHLQMATCRLVSTIVFICLHSSSSLLIKHGHICMSLLTMYLDWWTDGRMDGCICLSLWIILKCNILLKVKAEEICKYKHIHSHATYVWQWIWNQNLISNQTLTTCVP